MSDALPGVGSGKSTHLTPKEATLKYVRSHSLVTTPMLPSDTNQWWLVKPSTRASRHQHGPRRTGVV